MIKILTISIFVISFCLLCNCSNHDYSFDGSSFNFNTWQQSNNGFQCRRDDRYVIMCNLRWDTIMNELSNCEFGTAFMQCATGTNTVMFTQIFYYTSGQLIEEFKSCYQQILQAHICILQLSQKESNNLISQYVNSNFQIRKRLSST